MELWWITNLEELRREQRPEVIREQLQLPFQIPEPSSPPEDEDESPNVLIIEDP